MDEPTPLYVLLFAMRRKWLDQDLDGAVALARAAAPYVHAKVPAARPPDDLAGVTDDELERYGRHRGAAAADDDPKQPA